MAIRETKEEVLSDGDIWADSDDDFQVEQPDDELYGQRPEVAENSETSALRRVHGKKGYLDGLSASKEDSLQEGFDKGYPLGANIGMLVGQIVGQLQIIMASNDVNAETKQKALALLRDAQNELTIQKVLNRKYFDEDLNLTGDTHTLLQRWRSQCDELLASAFRS